MSDSAPTAADAPGDDDLWVSSNDTRARAAVATLVQHRRLT